MKTLLSLTLLLFCFIGYGQENNYYNSEHREKISQLADMLGEWYGEGWIMNRQSRQKESFEVTEEIKYGLDSTVLLIEGIGQDNEQIVHHALGILSVNPEGGFYMSSFLGDGRSGKYEMKQDGDFWKWTIPTPQGTIIYTIELTENSWIEKGAFDMNGTLFPFFEMNLVRKS